MSKWTYESAMKRVNKGGYKGLSYWGAWEYLMHYHKEKFLAETAAVVGA